jgi:hypothetical protein
MAGLLSLCETKYVSFLDGDDYYILDNKLQTQINFLENNFDYVLHSPVYKYDDQEKPLCSSIKELNFAQNIFANYVSCGVMYRNDILQKNSFLLQKYYNKDIFDPYWVFPLLALKSGKGYNENSGPISVVYRLHETSEFSQLSETNKTKKVAKQAKVLGQIHDADILSSTLKTKRNKNIIDFYTQTRNASFEGFVDVYNIANNKIIIQKKQQKAKWFSYSNYHLTEVK